MLFWLGQAFPWLFLSSLYPICIDYCNLVLSPCGAEPGTCLQNYVNTIAIEDLASVLLVNTSGSLCFKTKNVKYLHHLHTKGW